MKEKKQNTKKTIIRILVAIVIVVIALLLLKSCSNSQKEQTIKTTPQVNAPVVLEGLVYNGTSQTLIQVASTTGGTIQYALGNEKEATTSYEMNCPTAKDAGTYYVWYKVVGNEQFLDVEPKMVTVTIEKRNVTFTSGSSSKKYDGKVLTNNTVSISGDGFVGEEGINYTVTGSITNPGTLSNSFTYELNSATKQENYNITKVEGELTVSKCSVTASKPTVLLENVKSTTITLDAMVSNYGDCQYAISTKNVAPNSGWQTSTLFTNLKPETTYYCFARYAGNKFYKQSNPSSALEVTTKKYSITIGTLNYTKITSSIPTEIGIDEEVTLTFEVLEEYDTLYFNLDALNGDYVVLNIENCENEVDAETNSVTATVTLKNPTGDVTISDDQQECLIAGTNILMADFTTKKIEEIKEGDLVLTYNHEKGCLEPQKVYLAWASERQAKYFTLHFTNGIELSIVGDHCLFEKESLKYVEIYDYNATQFIGKHYYCMTTGHYEELLSVSYSDEKVDYYEIYTEYNGNCIAEGMLNVALDIKELLNFYKFNEDLSIDHLQLENDIATYGLIAYPEDALYSKETFDALGFKYYYIIVGKGLSSWDKLYASKEAFFDTFNTYY